MRESVSNGGGTTAVTTTADNGADIVAACLGDWGPWQRRAVLLIYLCKIPSAWFMASIIFTAPTPWPGEIFCAQVQVNDSTAAFHNSLSRLPERAPAADYCWQSDGNGSAAASAHPCELFGHYAEVQTVVTQFGLVCSRSILLAVSQFSHLFGVLVGGLLATKLLE